jgi:hypothetical protein
MFGRDLYTPLVLALGRPESPAGRLQHNQADAVQRFQPPHERFEQEIQAERRARETLIRQRQINRRRADRTDRRHGVRREQTERPSVLEQVPDRDRPPGISQELENGCIQPHIRHADTNANSKQLGGTRSNRSPRNVWTVALTPATS